MSHIFKITIEQAGGGKSAEIYAEIDSMVALDQFARHVANSVAKPLQTEPYQVKADRVLLQIFGQHFTEIP